MKASRDFICVRLAAFEDPAETAFLDRLTANPSRGVLKNSTYAILAPGGHWAITAVQRGPRYASPSAMAAVMKTIAAKYPRQEEGVRALPYARSFRLGLDIASCDLAPFVVVRTSDAVRREQIERVLAPLAWSDEFIGVFVYAAASTPDEVRNVDALPEGDGILVVQPDRFGLKGTVLAHDDGLTIEGVRSALRAGRAAFQAETKDTRKMIEEARAAGITWKDDPGPEAERKKR